MRLSSASLLFVAYLCLIGCSGPNGGADASDGGETTEQTYEPLDLSTTSLGTTFHHGEAGILRNSGNVAQTTIDRAKGVFGTGFVEVQIYDEHSWQFGEWEVYSPSNDNTSYRRGDVFRNDPDKGRFKPRAGDLIDEVENAFGGFGTGGLDRLGMIVDVWRMRGDWYVRWDGNLDQDSNKYGEGPYGFYRSDMTDNLVSQIRSVVGNEKPSYLVVGSDMGRLLGREGEPGLAPDEFSNFRQFYERVVDEVDKVSPDTLVGVGFDWDRFVKHVAPAYGEGETGEVPPRETIERAFDSVIYPLAESGGMLALKSYRRPGGDASYYGFLADLETMFEMEGISTVWYSIGAPVDSSVSYTRQRTYLDKFIEWNKGVEPDLVVWRSLLNIDGADMGDRTIGGRCKAMVDAKEFELDKRHCFDGLFDATFQPKEAFELLSEESKGN